jgi:hypothetical protein
MILEKGAHGVSAQVERHGVPLVQQLDNGGQQFGIGKLYLATGRLMVVGRGMVSWAFVPQASEES